MAHIERTKRMRTTDTTVDLVSGSVQQPSLTFQSDKSKGFYDKSAAQIGLAIGGSDCGYFDANGWRGKVAGISFPSSDASVNTTSTVVAQQIPLSSDGAGMASFSDTLPRYARFQLSNAQSKALNSTPQTLISAPGAGKMIAVHGWGVEVAYGGSAFSGGGAIDLVYNVIGQGTAGESVPATAVTQTASTVRLRPGFFANATSFLPLANVSNTPLRVYAATADFTGGGTGYFIVHVWYSILPASS